MKLIFRWCFQTYFFFGAAVVYVAYLFCIGGDFLEFRFIVPILPIVFWLIFDGAVVIYELGRTRGRSAAPATFLAAAIVIAFAIASHLGSTAFEKPRIRHGNETVQITKLYGDKRISQGKALRDLIDRDLLPADLRIETGGAGALPYYTDWYTLDKRGLNDVYLAHQPVKRRGQIAHERVAPLSYVKSKKIAVYLVGNVLLYEETARRLPGINRMKRRTLARRYNRRNRNEKYRLRLECRIPEPGKQLIFATNMEPQEFETILGHIPSCI